MADSYELYEPTETSKTHYLGSIRIGRKGCHISPLSELSKQDLINVFENGELDVRTFMGRQKKALPNNPGFVQGRWCEMIVEDFSTDEDTWLHRALGDNITNKKILILRREGRPLHRYHSEISSNGSWYKIAIEDTATGNILLRTFHNIPKENLGETRWAQPTTDGWFFVGGSRGPSTLGADKTFWLDLQLALN